MSAPEEHSTTSEPQRARWISHALKRSRLMQHATGLVRPMNWRAQKHRRHYRKSRPWRVIGIVGAVGAVFLFASSVWIQHNPPWPMPEQDEIAKSEGVRVRSDWWFNRVAFFEPSTLIKLGWASIVDVQSQPESDVRILRLYRGTIYVDTEDASRPFLVRIGNGLVGVCAKRFRVMADRTKREVQVVGSGRLFLAADGELATPAEAERLRAAFIFSPFATGPARQCEERIAVSLKPQEPGAVADNVTLGN